MFYHHHTTFSSGAWLLRSRSPPGWWFALMFVACGGAPDPSENGRDAAVFGWTDHPPSPLANCAESALDPRVCPRSPLLLPNTCASPIDLPRLLRPRSGEVLSTTTPEFRWRLPHEDVGLRSRIDVCDDRACKRVLVTESLSANRWRPSMALPAGTRFWRVTSSEPGGAMPRTSTTRAVIVPTAEATQRAGARRWLDFDGDGTDDVVEEGQTFGSIRVRSSTPTVPDTVIPAEPGVPVRRLDWAQCRGSMTGTVSESLTLRPAGDVDGDGYMDALITQRMMRYTCVSPFRERTQAIYLAFGGPDGLQDTLIRLAAAEDAGTQENWYSIVPGDDYDADGGDELLSTRGSSNFDACFRDFLSTSVYFAGPGHCLRSGFVLQQSAEGAVTIPDVNGDETPEVCGKHSGLWHCSSLRDRVEQRIQLPLSCAGTQLRYPVPCSGLGCGNFRSYQEVSVAMAARDINNDGLADLMSEVELPDGRRNRVTFFGGRDGLSSEQCEIGLHDCRF